MAWYSILPPQLTHLESWAVRIFFLLGLITIVPWAALIIFDASFYLYRMLLWELPWIGGRARGEQRPRAPSLNERPDGQRRAFGPYGVETDTADGEEEKIGDADTDSHRLEQKDPDEAWKENVVTVMEGLNSYANQDGDLKRRVSGRI